MRRKGSNIYALGARSAGRQQLIEDLLRHQAETERTPADWCYVNNFVDPQQPRCLSLPAGRGAAFEAAMKRLVEELRAALPAAFERDDYRARQQVIEQQFKERSEQAFGALQQHAEGKGIALMRTPMGLALAPKRDGRVVSPEDFEALPADQREQTQREIEGIQGELEALMRQVPVWEREHRDALRALNRDTAAFAIGHLLEDLRNGYRDLRPVVDYLDPVERDIKENIDDFLAPAPPPRGAQGPGPAEAPGDDSRFRRYRVNLIVDNGAQKGAPVINEDNPTHQTLVGRIDNLARFGALITDFNLIAPGALHRANAGCRLPAPQNLLPGSLGWGPWTRGRD